MINITQIYKVNMYFLLDHGRFTVCMEYMHFNLGIDG